MTETINQINLLDQGFVCLERSSCSDLDVVNAAKVSYNKHSKEMGEHEQGVLEFMMKNRHGTPFEHNMFTFRIKAPIVVFREWHRHRVGHSYNEWSARYSEMKREFFIPDYVRQQIGKPGAYTYEAASTNVTEEFRARLQEHSDRGYDEYQRAMKAGIAKEQARLFLSFNLYSEMYWTCNARSLMHFLALRNEEHAMWEIQQYAKAAEVFFEHLMPLTHAAFVKHGRHAP